MATLTTRDGTELYYKDWGTGQPIVFSHGWPLNADAWDEQMLHLASNGYRCIAHDRRGHGRSSQPWEGNEMDTYADDLAELIEHLDLRDVVLVGHSTGGGEVTRYIGRHGTGRVARAVLIGAVPPLMLHTPANPEGQPREVFDEIRAGLLSDRSQYYRDLSAPFYGANRPGAQVSDGTRDTFWRWCMQAGLKGAYDSVRAFSETDFTDDLKKFDIPTLIIHGEDDQIVPIGASAMISSKLVRDDPTAFYIFESWTDPVALGAHEAEPRVRAALTEEVVPDLVAPPMRTRARMLSSPDPRPDRPRPVAGSPTQLTLIPFFTIKAGEVEAVRRAHLSVVESTRAEPGCIDYDLYQSLDDPSVLFFYENWTDADALAAHLSTPTFYRVVRGEVDGRLVVPWTALSLTMVSESGA